MKNYLRQITFIVALFTGNSVWANCPELNTHSGVIQVIQFWNEDRTACAIEVKPRHTPNSQYRSFYTDSTGLFVVHNSYGLGPARTHKSYRDFMILPLKNYKPTFKTESNRDVTITLASGHELRVSGRDFSVKDFSPGLIQESPLARDNNGGFEFYLKEGFWFDGGFKVGVSPLSYPLSTSVLRSAKSPSVISCRLTNQEYLAYKDGKFVVRYDGEALINFLSYSCGQLKF